MGVFDFLKKKEITKADETVNTNSYKTPVDIEYVNNEGQKVEVRFAEIVQIEGKYLQKVYIDTKRVNIPDKFKSIFGEEYLMEPYNLYKDENDKILSQTKEYYEYIAGKSEEDIKTFFDLNEIDYMPTKYIGKLDEYKGNYIRNTDKEFEARYLSMIKEKNKNNVEDFLTPYVNNPEEMKANIKPIAVEKNPEGVLRPGDNVR